MTCGSVSNNCPNHMILRGSIRLLVSNSRYDVDNKLSSGSREFYGVSDIMLVTDFIVTVQCRVRIKSDTRE
jgi:hypothetical protein